MQTQAQLGSKKFKHTVPFYNPPPRIYGQTPAEIIKEARAAVMLPPAIGIKPVLTSRPFTPKEKERTLFGTFNKRNKHPYSLGLKNSQNQDVGSRLKLPSIESLPSKKSFSYFKRSHNLSLDNLTEDYAAETIAEIGEKEKEKNFLPTKSHSCPKEGRIAKSSSYNELSKKILFPKKDDFEKRGSNTNKNLDSDLLQSEFFNSYEGTNSSAKSFDVRSESSENSVEYYRYQNMIRGSGDYETNDIYSENSLTEDSDEKETLSKTLKSEIGELEQLDPIDDCEFEVEKKNLNEKPKILNNTLSSLKNKDLAEPEKNFEEKKLPLKVNNKSEDTDRKIENSPGVNDGEEDKVPKNRHCNTLLLEKSTGTGSNSQYLAMLKNNSKKPKVIFENGNSDSIPLEILELYETANYYSANVQEEEKKIKEDELNSLERRNKNFNENPSNYLKHLKENHEEINEQMKKLQVTITNIEESKSSNMEKKQESENIEFEMNNKRKYHVVGGDKNKKEKVYEKYRENQISSADPPSAQNKKGSSNDSWDIFWKNSYYRNEESEKPKKEVELQRLLYTIAGLNKIGAENKEISEKFNQLYDLIKSNEMDLDNKCKNNIVKVIQLFATSEDAVLLLNLARLLFYLKVDSLLTMACKMIFKVAGLDTNDPLFLEHEDALELFMEGIGRASPLDCAECCVYGYGALKFLTMNYNILSRILNMGALDLMTLHLKLINTTFAEKGNVGEQTHHALFQMTGALRNVAEGEGALPLFITTDCVPVICKSLDLFQKDEDVITNISRTLSLLSSNESIIEPLMSVSNFLNTVLSLMSKYKENVQILIRLSFCLGNIVEHSDLARVQLSRNEGCFTTLLNILKFYIDKDLEISMNQNSINNSLSPDAIDDIIVKVIRIIANMSMNPIVGSNLSPTTTEKKSLQLSQLLSVLLMRKDPGITLLATLGCLNNISYYCKTHSVLIDITQGVERVLELPSEECQAEAARVLGNLTRHKEIRDIIFNTGGINKLIKLLSSGKQEVVRYTCGALVNIMLDSQSRLEFVEAQGIDKLVEVVEMFSDDWSLASLATRAIWNSCAEDVSSMIKHSNVECLLNLLANSLEEENWNDGNPAWEEFASIATDLLEKINTHLDST